MKNTSLIINIVLAIAVGVLFYLFFTQKTGKSTGSTSSGKDSASLEPVKVLVIRTDTLMFAYNYAKELSTQYDAALQPDIEKVGKLEKQLQYAYSNLQKNGATMTTREQAKAQEDIARLEQTYQKLGAEVQQKLAYAEQELMFILGDTLNNAVKHFAEIKNADIVLQGGSNLFIRNQSLDISAEMIDYLNSRYRTLQVPNLPIKDSVAAGNP